jgi:hypothetical protein
MQGSSGIRGSLCRPAGPMHQRFFRLVWACHILPFIAADQDQPITAQQRSVILISCCRPATGTCIAARTNGDDSLASRHLTTSSDGTGDLLKERIHSNSARTRSCRIHSYETTVVCCRCSSHAQPYGGNLLATPAIGSVYLVVSPQQRVTEGNLQLHPWSSLNVCFNQLQRGRTLTALSWDQSSCGCGQGSRCHAYRYSTDYTIGVV